MSGVITLLGGGSMLGFAGSGFGGIANAVSSVFWRTLTSVHERLQTLGLAGVEPESIVIQKLPVDRRFGATGGIALPAVVISPERETMDPRVGTNALDDVTYTVRLTMFDRDNQETTLAAHLDRYLAWREQIARAFRNQRLNGVPEIFTASVEPTEVINAGEWAKNLFVSAVLLKFTSREPRGY
jgi:hypothetical protein